MKCFGYYVIKVFLKPLSLLPLRFHRAVGAFLGWLAGSVFRYRRDVVMTNLSRSFPDKKYDELTSICNDFYRHFGRLIGEAVWFGSASFAKLHDAHIVEIDNPELLNNFTDKGRSVFILTSHRGNWELMGGYKSYTYNTISVNLPEKDFCVVYKRQTSRAWDEFLYENRISPLADKSGYDGLVETYSIMRYAFNHRMDAKHYYFITDQYPYTVTSKVPVNDFMHQATCSMNGGPALAKMFGMAVVYMDMALTPEGNYRIHYTTITENAADMEITDILNRYYELLQADLEKDPANYLWTHKRWK